MMDEQREELDPAMEVAQPTPQENPMAMVVPPAEVPGVVSIDTRDPAAFAQHLASDEAIAEARSAMAAYDRAVAALVGPNDEIEEGGKKFKKKSAWKKMARFFRVTTSVTSRAGGWELVYDPTLDTMLHHYTAHVVVRGVAPWGQAAECLASCSTSELRFFTQGPACPKCGGGCWDNRGDRGQEDFACKNKGSCGGKIMPGDWSDEDVGLMPNRIMRAKAVHDCMATAETRASNRATSALIAAGEVSADEVETGRGSYNPPTNGPEDSQKGFDLDGPAIGKKCQGRTWRQMCKDEPGYVEWSIENMGQLDDDAKRILKECLLGPPKSPDDGAGKPLPWQEGGSGTPTDTSEPTNGNGDDPLDGKPTFGKYQDRTWRELADNLPDYVKRWCIEADRVDGRLLAALEAALMPRPEQEPQQRKGSIIPEGHTWEDKFATMCTEAETSPEGEQALAVVSPNYPDRFTDWTEANYQHACRTFESHGTLATIAAALKEFEKRERGRPTPETPLAPAKVRELYASVGERAVKLELVSENEMQAVGLLLDAGTNESVEAVNKEITKWQQMLLDHFAAGGSQ